jgi:hypothetical protein
MISVEFRSVGPGQCSWCRRERDEVYQVAFSDRSFIGAMCRGDLLRAIGMKIGIAADSGQATMPAASTTAGSQAVEK